MGIIQAVMGKEQDQNYKKGKADLSITVYDGPAKRVLPLEDGDISLDILQNAQISTAPFTPRFPIWTG